MEEKIDNNTVLDFVKLLLGYTNYSLDDVRGTILTNEGKECTAEDPIDRQVKPIRVVKPGMADDKGFTNLNPFIVLEGVQPALDWFYVTRICGLSAMIKKTIVACVKTGVEGKSEDYEALGLISGLSEKFDAQMVTELEKINCLDIFKIFYNKSTKTAEAQTELFTSALEKQHKFRKKTWSVVRTLFLKILKIEKEDDLSKFKYKATILNIPDVDAKLHVFGAVMSAARPYIEKLMGIDLHVKEFNRHMKNLETYVKLCAWITTAVGKNGQTTTSRPAWTDIPIAPRSTPGMAIPIKPSSGMMPSLSQDTSRMPPATPVNSTMATGMMPQVTPTAPPPISVSSGGMMPPLYSPSPMSGMMPSTMPIGGARIQTSGRIPEGVRIPIR